MRVVLDANVIISALLSRSGAPATLLARWHAGAFDLIVSEQLLTEVRRILAMPKVAERLDSAHASAIVQLVRERAELVADPEGAPPLRASDPGDDYLLALASHVQALLVSGDAHLLELADRAPILTPRELLDRLDA